MPLRAYKKIPKSIAAPISPTTRRRRQAWGVFQSAIFLPPTESLDEWTLKYRRLSPEASNETGRYDFSRAVYQREILHVLGHPKYRKVVIMTSAQIGKTEMLLCLVGYHIHRDPCPILFLEPTLEMAKAIAKDRIEPMLRDTPALRHLVRDYRGLQANRRGQSSSRLHKSFPGGHFTLAGSNSVATLASRPIRLLVCDEVDRWSRLPGKIGESEGDKLSLAEKRTTTFTYNKKIIIISSPGNKGSSRIEWEFLRSDQRHPYVPCPHCDTFQILQFKNFACDKLDNGLSILPSAHFACIQCGLRIEQKHKHAILQKQEWRAHRPESRVPGFWIWEAYSPWRSWPEIAAEEVSKRAGGDETYQTFVNLTLGETFEQKGDAPPLEIMRGLVDAYNQWTVPAGVVFLTAGLDVQGDRVEASIWGWGRGQECWLIGHKVIYGSAQYAGTWSEVDSFLQSDYAQASTGRRLRPWLACIDSGYETHSVYAFCRDKGQVRPTKGSSNIQDPPILTPSLQDIDYAGGKIEGGVTLWRLGVGQIKIVLYSRMKLQPKEGMARVGEKFIHLHAGLTDSDLLQMSSEQLVREPNRSGYVRQRWVKKYDNERLDCLVNAYAAALMLGIEEIPWSELEGILDRQQQGGAGQRVH